MKKIFLTTLFIFSHIICLGQISVNNSQIKDLSDPTDDQDGVTKKYLIEKLNELKIDIFNEIDDDGDGYSENEGDCDDFNNLIYPYAPETGDGIDNNCDGVLGDEDLIFLIDSSVPELFYETINLWGIHMDGLADQISTTNAYLDFLGFTDQPRRPLNNNPTNSNLYPISGPWDSFYKLIENVNPVLKEINEGRTIVDTLGIDLTKEKEMAGYFVRGIALGFIGMIYDKGYFPEQLSSEPHELINYAEILNYATLDLEKSIEISKSNEVSKFQIYNGNIIDDDEFRKVAHSYLAKILMGSARTSGDYIDYYKVLYHLNQGITADFDPGAKNGVIYNNYQDWATYTLGTGAGYLPVDQKIAYLAEGDETAQPKDYPTEESVILGEISNTSDPRIANYFAYTSDFGYLNPTHGRHLFSNTRHARFFTNNNRNFDGASLNLFPLAELHYLKAEVQLKLQNLNEAKIILDQSVRGQSGLVTNSDFLSIKKALLYEYAIEMHLNGSAGTNYFFMRRNDLLQDGTPLQYPVPANELVERGIDFYTFGGFGAGNPSTALGPGWKDF